MNHPDGERRVDLWWKHKVFTHHLDGLSLLTGDQTAEFLFLLLWFKLSDGHFLTLKFPVKQRLKKSHHVHFLKKHVSLSVYNNYIMLQKLELWKKEKKDYDSEDWIIKCSSRDCPVLTNSLLQFQPCWPDFRGEKVKVKVIIYHILLLLSDCYNTTLIHSNLKCFWALCVLQHNYFNIFIFIQSHVCVNFQL